MSNTFDTILWSENKTVRAVVRVTDKFEIGDMNWFNWNDVFVCEEGDTWFQAVHPIFMTEGLEQEILEVIN